MRHKKDVILEPCYEWEEANVASADDSLVTYFYFHLPVIYDLGILIIFPVFEAEFLTTVNVAPSKIMPFIRGIIMDFKIRCRWLEVTPTIRVFFSFYSFTKSFDIQSCETNLHISQLWNKFLENEIFLHISCIVENTKQIFWESGKKLLNIETSHATMSYQHVKTTCPTSWWLTYFNKIQPSK